MEADKDGDGKLSFEEFTNIVSKTVRPFPLRSASNIFLIRLLLGHRETNDARGFVLTPVSFHSGSVCLYASWTVRDGRVASVSVTYICSSILRTT